MITTIVSNISIIIASIVALYGIRSWQVELRGRRRMELAEEALVLFYRARDVIVAIRSPMSFAGEGASRNPEPGETATQKRARDMAQITFERYQKYSTVFEQLTAARYRFLAYFGADAATPFDELFKIKSEILLAARMLAVMWARPSDFNENQPPSVMADRISAKEEVIWWTDTNNDKIQKRVEAAIAQMESTCHAYLGKSKSAPGNFWWSFLKGEWWR